VLRKVVDEALRETRVALLVDGAALSIVTQVVIVPLRVEARRRGISAAATPAAPASAEIRMTVRQLRRRHRGKLRIFSRTATATAAVLCGRLRSGHPGDRRERSSGQ